MLIKENRHIFVKNIIIKTSSSGQKRLTGNDVVNVTNKRDLFVMTFLLKDIYCSLFTFMILDVSGS